MSSVWHSFSHGSKWLGRNVIPWLSAAGGAAYGAAGNFAGAAATLSAGQAIKGQVTPDGGPTQSPVALPDQEAISAARRKSAALQLSRSGRAATVLSTDPSDTLGG